jgi:hypothetical protein
MAKISKVLGSISPLAGAVTGEGLFGKGLAKLADSGAGFLVPASYLAQSQRKKKQKEAQAGMGMRDAGMGAPIMGGDVDAMMGRISQRDKPGMKKGGKVKKMAKGGSTASKRADGCATKGKTKGRFV